jgi:dihydroorotate dehydrogenase electron transfer subunit
MKQLLVKISNIQQKTPTIFQLSFQSPEVAQTVKPAQFIHIKLEKPAILRRPFSVHSVGPKNQVDILFRVVGKGTLLLKRKKPGQNLDILGPLGNGFMMPQKESDDNIIIGGGMGVAPLFFLSQRLSQVSRKIKILLGAKTAEDLLIAQKLEANGYRVAVATDDGSAGVKGSVLDLLPPEAVSDKNTNIYACGPRAMFKKLKMQLPEDKQLRCQVSFEQFMGCGVGICLGCAVNTTSGYKRACKEGPVFNLSELEL